MDEDESLRRYGLRPSGRELDAVRALLEAEAAKERRAQGDGDTELMKLFCVQLFNAAEVGDALAIWRAKSASFDAHCSIDVRLLCGAGLAETKAFLSAQRSEQARPPFGGCSTVRRQPTSRTSPSLRGRRGMRLTTWALKIRVSPPAIDRDRHGSWAACRR
jgi:hypothetical protein